VPSYADNLAVPSATGTHTGIPLYRLTRAANTISDATLGHDTPGKKRINRHTLYCRTLAYIASAFFYLFNNNIAIAGLYSVATVCVRSSAFTFQRTCINHSSSTTLFGIFSFVTLSCYMPPMSSKQPYYHL
jgi:hypothetical protein